MRLAHGNYHNRAVAVAAPTSAVDFDRELSHRGRHRVRMSRLLFMDLEKADRGEGHCPSLLLWVCSHPLPRAQQASLLMSQWGLCQCQYHLVIGYYSQHQIGQELFHDFHDYCNLGCVCLS